MKTINELPCFVKNSTTLLKASIAKPKSSIKYVSSDQDDAFYFRHLESKGIFLNKQQVDAIRTDDGPVLINSIPGSGKSTVITCKIGYLISVKNTRPENLLAITFTRKAALSLNKKLEELGIPGSRDVMATTFHSLCLKIMKLVGLKRFKMITSEKHKEYIIKKILKDLKLENDYPTEKIVNQLSYIKTSMLVNENPINNFLTANQFNIYNKYEEYKKFNGLMDFDDLLYNGWKILKTSPYILKLLQDKFLYVTVDEYQDLCPIEHAIIKLLVSPLNNIFAVGDLAQNIFSFRGSNTKYMSDFEKEFENAKILNLNVNYRSTSPIIGLSDQVLKYLDINRNSIAVKDSDIYPICINIYDSVEEAHVVVDKILELIHENNIQPKDICILFRASSTNQFIVEELIINNLPFIEHNSKELLYSDPIVKPLIDYLKLSIDPTNISAFTGILGTLYLNKTLALSWLNKNKEEGVPLFDEYLQMPNLKDYHYEILSKRKSLVNSISELSPLKAIREIRSDFYDKYIKIDNSSIITISKESLADIMAELEESASRFNTITDFLEYIEIVTIKYQEVNNCKDNENINAISLMSIHRSKGLEFPIVFVISVIEDVIPHKRAIDEAILSDTSCLVSSTLDNVLDEECRLLYVAVTRAKDKLYISIPQTYHSKPAKVSRFLETFF